MAKRLNYQIGVSADTSQFTQQMTQALQQLQNLGSKTSMVSGLQDASSAARDLRDNLQSAFNQDTGKLDLAAFNSNLEKSHMTLTDYYNQLVKLGTDGEEAFMNVAQSILSAELPLRRTNKLMDELWVTMKNTMRWQLTSSVLHGFIGSLETAYGYAKSLDSSLNNIRIVTNKSTDEMRKFAEQANEAAKALSATTTDYTDASLIYYQQGLDDEQVKERTETTIKLANVTRQSAEDVSSEMTAIWNNYADGSKNLEYYADVITALGAATASSSEEIANGLQKFAAVANVVGISYEYSTAALATLVAQTRQSEDTVGTSLRTLFSRIEGLQLGETLEDGTDLNKYSQALATVGVDIKDSNGELRNMDDILDDIGAKWQTLAKDEQMALAQTVGGVRQYTTFVSLMDNWDKFQENVKIATGSTGTLQQQADIYAESWEAARDRVTASAEDIYDSLINPDFYIGLDNMVTPLLDRTADVIDALGGLQGVLSVVALLVNKIYGDKIASAMRDIAANLGIIEQKDSARAKALQEETAALSKNLAYEKAGLDTNSMDYQRLDNWSKVVEVQQRANEEMRHLTSSQVEQLDYDVQHLQKLQEQLGVLKQTKETYDATAQNQIDWMSDRLVSDDDWYNKLGDAIFEDGNPEILQEGTPFEIARTLKSAYDSQDVDEAFIKLQDGLQGASEKLAQYEELQSTLDKTTGKATDATIDLAKKLELLKKDASPAEIEEFTNGIDGFTKETEEAKTEIDIFKKAIQSIVEAPDVSFQNKMTTLITAYKKGAITAQEFADQAEKVDAGVKQVNQNLDAHAYSVRNWADTLVSVGTAASSISILVNGIQNLFNVFTDEDMSPVERFTSILTTMTMVIPSVTSLLGAFTKQKQADSLATTALNAISAKDNVTEATGVVAKTAATIALKMKSKAVADDSEKITDHTLKQIADNAAMATGLIYLGLAVVAIAAVSLAIYGLVKAYNKDADAAKEAAEQVENLTTTYEECQQAAQDLKDTISDYTEAQEALEELEKGTDEYKEALKEANEQAKELIETYKLFNKGEDYTIEDGQIKISDEALDRIQRQADDAARLAESNLYAAKIVASQTAQTSSVTNARRSLGDIVNPTPVYDENGNLMYYNGRQLTNTEIQDAVSQLITLMEDSTFIPSEVDIEDLLGVDILDSSVEEVRNALISLATSANDAAEANEYYAHQIIQNEVEEQVGGNLEEISENTDVSYDSLLEAVTNKEEQIMSGLEEATKLENLKIGAHTFNGNLGIANDEELARVYAQEVLGYSATDAAMFNYAGGTGKGSLKTISGEEIFTDMSDKDMRYQIAIARAKEAAIAEIQASTEGQFDEEAYTEQLNKLVAGAEDLGDKFGDINFGQMLVDSLANGNKIDFSSISNELSEAQANKIKDMSQEDLLAYFGEIDWTQFGYDDGADFATAFQSAVEETYNPDVYKQSLYEKAESGESSARSLITKVQSGDVNYQNINEDEDYTNLMAQLDSLKDEYPDIQAAVIELSKNWEVGTQKYAEALEIVQDKLSSIHFQELEENAQEASDKVEEYITRIPDKVQENLSGQAYIEDTIEIDADAEGFLDTMEGLLDANYAIDIEVHTQMEQEFDSITTAMDDIAEKSGLIGENFIVAASDVRELNNTFPGILEGLTDLHDGTVQLNAETVQSSMEAAQAEVANESTSFVEKAELQASLLRLKQKTYLQMAEAAATLAKSDTISEQDKADAISAIDGGVADLKTYNSQLVANEQSGDFAEVTDSAKINGEDTANNWNEAYAEAAHASAAFARAAILNNQAVAANSLDSISDYNYQVNYKGTSGTSEENSVLEESQKLLDETLNDETQKKWAELEALYRNLADSAGDTANDIEGMIYEIGARNVELGNSLSNTGKSSSSGSSSSDLGDEEKIERYLYINRLLDQQSELIDDIDDQTSRTYGAERLQAYSDKMDALNKQIELYNEKLKEANIWLEQDKKSLTDYFANQNLPVALQFDDAGNISNADTIERLLVERYNDALAAGSETMAELTKEQLEAARDYIEQYEETLDLIRELNQSVIESEQEKWDAYLDQIAHRLEVATDAKELRDNIRDWQRSYNEALGDALTHNLEAGKIATEQFEDDISMIPSLIENYNSLTEALANATDETDKSRIIDDLMSLQERFSELGDQILDFVDIFANLLPDAVDAARDRFNQFVDQLDHNIDVFDTVSELLTLQGMTAKTDSGFKAFQKLLKDRMDAQVTTAKLNRQVYEEAKAALEQAEQALSGVAEDDINYNMYKNNRDALLEEYNAALEDMLSSAQEAMETAQEMFTQAIEKAAADFDSAMSNGLSLDFMEEKYDNYIEEEERYLDAVNELYEVNKWNNKLQADIDTTTNKVYQQKLKQLQEEIDLRREGNTLSQYDLDILEAKYNMLLAEMALEDAQNAKTNLRLVRDAQGNWNYQYTADQDAIADAQDQLLDAQNEYYNIAKQHVNDTTSAIVQLYAEASDAIKEVWDDLTLSDEERTAKLEEIERYYIEKIKYLEEEKNIAIEDMTAAGLETIDDFKNEYADTLDELDGDVSTFQTNLEEYMAECEDAFNSLNETVQFVAEETGTALGDDSSGLIAIVNETTEATTTLGEQGAAAIDSMYAKIGEIQSLTSSFADMAYQIESAIAAINNYNSLIASTVSSASGTATSSSSSETGNPMIDYSSMIALAEAEGLSQDIIDTLYARRQWKMDNYDEYSKYISNSDLQTLLAGYTDTQLRNYGAQYLNEFWELLQQEGLIGYSTGGYTGDFDDGKLAILHEKELVLNQQDTENILAAVDLLRSIDPDVFKTIESNLDQYIDAAVASLVDKLATTSNISPVGDVLEQDVHVEAVFPNVTDHNEITEAFNTIVNDAAQWARRRTE